MFERHQYNRQIAIALKSSDKAFMVEFIKYSIEYKAEKPEQYQPHTDGKYYTWDTQKAWQKRMPWLSARTISRHLSEIRDSGLVQAEYLSKNFGDRTLYYTINYELYRQFERSIGELASPILPNRQDTILPNRQDQMLPNLHNLLPNNLTNNHTKNTRSLSLHKKCIAFDETMASEWLSWSKSVTPNGRYNKIGFANAIMKMRTKHKMTEEMIQYMLNWIKGDEFWTKNAISPASLLKPSPSNPDITKLDRVISAIKARKKTQSEKVYDAVLEAEKELARQEAQSPQPAKIYLEGEPW